MESKEEKLHEHMACDYGAAWTAALDGNVQTTLQHFMNTTAAQQ